MKDDSRSTPDSLNRIIELPVSGISISIDITSDGRIFVDGDEVLPATVLIKDSTRFFEKMKE